MKINDNEMKELYNYCKRVGTRYFYRYKKLFLATAYSADDLTQISYMKMLEVLDRYKDTKPLEEIKKLSANWIIWDLNKLRDKLIRRNKHEVFLEEPVEAEYSVDMSAYFLLDDIQSFLTAPEFKIISQRFVEDKNFKQIAESLTSSPATAYRNYKKTLEKIKKNMK